MSRPSRWENQVNPGKVTFIVWGVCVQAEFARKSLEVYFHSYESTLRDYRKVHFGTFIVKGVHVQVTGPEMMTFIVVDFHSLDFHSQGVCMSSRAEQNV